MVHTTKSLESVACDTFAIYIISAIYLGRFPGHGAFGRDMLGTSSLGFIICYHPVLKLAATAEFDLDKIRANQNDDMKSLLVAVS